MIKKITEIEKKITFDEFKAWMNGLIYGKGNSVPDFHDWELIKQMMERVVPDKVEMQNPAPYPVIQTPVVSYTEPRIPSPTDTWEITCSDDVRNVTIGGLSGGDYGAYGTTNFGAAEYIGSLPDSGINIDDSVKSITPALDKARVLLKQFQEGDE